MKFGPSQANFPRHEPSAPNNEDRGVLPSQQGYSDRVGERSPSRPRSRPSENRSGHTASTRNGCLVCFARVERVPLAHRPHGKVIASGNSARDLVCQIANLPLRALTHSQVEGPRDHLGVVWKVGAAGTPFFSFVKPIMNAPDARIGGSIAVSRDVGISDLPTVSGFASTSKI